jgi:ATP-dependent exoDNAse (exonuclease V) beta subunit
MTEHEAGAIAESFQPPAAHMLRRIKLPRPVEHGMVAIPSKAGRSAGDIPKRSLNRVERAVGTVVHLVLEQLAGAAIPPRDLQDCHDRCWSREQSAFELRRLGLSGAALSSAITAVEASINQVLGDENGQWLLSSAHNEASSELPLSCKGENGKLLNLIIDRTFIDAQTGVCWLVDYKNSQPLDGEQREDFLTREEASYTTQLTAYKSALLGLRDEPIQCALYFTALGYLHKV